MNIFYLDNDPKTCAQMHNDKHCVKMILEYAQLLSTAHRIIDGTESIGLSKSGRKQKRYVLHDHRDTVLYTATHTNHPSAIWVRQSDANYAWLYRLFGALMDEYTYRYGKIHACERLSDALSYRPKNIPKGSFTEPTPAMPEDYKVVGDSITSYRNYYLNDKVKMSRWTNSPMPIWFADGINTLYGDACYIERDDKRDRIISMPLYEYKNAHLHLP
jgi:hypothetical protein